MQRRVTEPPRSARDDGLEVFGLTRFGVTHPVAP